MLKALIIIIIIIIIIRVNNYSLKQSVYKLLLKVKLAIVVEGDPKASLSIATTPRWRRSLLHFTLDLYCTECLARRHQVPFFESFG